MGNDPNRRASKPERIMRKNKAGRQYEVVPVQLGRVTSHKGRLSGEDVLNLIEMLQSEGMRINRFRLRRKG